MANVAAVVIMVSHLPAVIGSRTPLYLPICVDNWHDTTELTTELTA
jgi:hypothetical protein